MSEDLIAGFVSNILPRRVIVNHASREDVKGFFHGWGYDVIEGEINTQFSVGIIEYLDGTVELVYPNNITFMEEPNE